MRVLFMKLLKTLELYLMRPEQPADEMTRFPSGNLAADASSAVDMVILPNIFILAPNNKGNMLTNYNKPVIFDKRSV